MSEEQKKAQDDLEEEDEGINLLDYLIILAKHKNLILVVTLSVAIITSFLAVSLKATFYQAETLILPPLQQDTRLASQFMREFGVFPAAGSSAIGKRELLVEIINSRTFTDSIIDRFHLKEAYGEEHLTRARHIFLTNVSIEPDFRNKKAMSFRGDDSPLMKIFVRDMNPKRSADIANAIVEELQTFVNNIAISEASQRRLFFEQQLNNIKAALVKSEDEVKMFQQKTGLLQVESQTAMAIEKSVGLQAQITSKEVELQVMKLYSTAGNPEYQRLEETIKVLKKELAKLETDHNNGDMTPLVPSRTIPALGLEYKRKLRELKFNETLYEMMLKQYEAAKMDESKDAVLIQVIDKAVAPEKAATVRMFGFKKALIVTVFACFISCLLAFYIDFRKRTSNKTNERLSIIKEYLLFRK